MKKLKQALSLTLALVLSLALAIPAASAAGVTVTQAVPFKYDAAWAFSDGLGLVFIRGSGYGYVDKTGKEVVPCKYVSASRFYEGRGRVRVNGKWGFIDTTGKEVIPCKYEQANNFSDGLAAVCLYGKWGFIDTTGKEVIPCQYPDVRGSFGMSIGYMYNFSEGYAPIIKDGMWGYIDKTGKVVVPFKYDGVEGYSEGLAVARTGVSPDTTWYYIDTTTGREVITLPHHSYAYKFSEGIAVVDNSNHKSYCIDRTGNALTPAGKYINILPFSEGFGAVLSDEWKWGYIDQTGKEVLSIQYNGAGQFSRGLAHVGLDNDTLAYIDKTGNVVMSFQRDKYRTIYDFSEGFALVQSSDGKLGYIDETGKEVVPCQYETPVTPGFDLDEHDISYDNRHVSEGMVAVRLNDKLGFLAFNTGATTTPEVTQPAGPQISDWAKEQVARAEANGLVADGLGNNYQANITRAQFAATAVKLYEAMSGQTAPAAGNSPFTDTSDPAVIQAQALGFVSGVGDGKFAPDALVTREQAASMLSRVYTKLGGNIPTVTATTFADNGSVSAWARDAVAFMSDKGIVSGTGNNNFTPQGNASIEQALSIALRMFENLK